MFTGLVEAQGTVVHAAGTTPRRLTIGSTLDQAGLAVGDSVALDGCCLTVVAHDAGAGTLTFEAATETLGRTTLGALVAGDRVHLERAMRLSDRLGGHLVAGHVDAVGTVQAREQRGSALYLGVAVVPEVLRLMAPRGSVTLAGVSLTVTEVSDGAFWVGLIPHTIAVTTLGDAGVGARLNVEADLLARYVERLLAASQLTCAVAPMAPAAAPLGAAAGPAEAGAR